MIRNRQFFPNNSEIELSAIVNLVYLAARDKYRVDLILELKADSKPEAAIQQIKDKNYAPRFQGKIGERAKYAGRILAVGISHDRKAKEYSCKIEVL